MSFASERGRLVPPDLDDRTWQDLVDDMRALIPQYAPAWTDQTPSDIGITLIELFAWLVEGLIYRLNQVPEKNYIAFLNLLGITRDPPAPARTYLTFTTGAGPMLLPAGTQAQTPVRDGEPPVVFETDEDVIVLPVTLDRALTIGPYTTVTPSAVTYDEVSARLVGPPADKYPVTVPPGQTVQLCFGFSQATSAEIMLRLRMYAPVPAPAAPTPTTTTVSWAFSQRTVEPTAWQPAPAVVDATDSLRHDGTVRLTLPADWAAQRPTAGPGGQEAADWTTVTARQGGGVVTDPRFWVGLRIANTATVPLTVGFDRIAFNSALARTALTVRTPEILGESTGGVFQTFALRHRPLYRRPGSADPYGDLVVQVGQGTSSPGRGAAPPPTTWETWTRVDELPAGAGNVYRLDPVAGEISFGNFDARAERGEAGTGQDDEQAAQGHGSIPPAGSLIQALSYRYVSAGAAGNVLPGQVTAPGPLPSGALPTGITGVTNLGPGQDGTDEEPIEDTLRRAPQQLKIRDRAVTAEDYEYLAREATSDVAISRCLSPYPLQGDPWTYAGIVRAPGTVNLIIVPDQGPSVRTPAPPDEMTRAVREHLDQRRDMTAQLAIHGPRYLPIVVTVDITAWQQAIDAGVTERAVTADTLKNINAFLHPTRGGPAGKGWQVGQPVFSSDLFRAIMPPEDVGYISSLLIRPGIPLYHFPPLNPAGTDANYNNDKERPFPLLAPGTPPGAAGGASVRVADYELVCAAADSAHVISIRKTDA